LSLHSDFCNLASVGIDETLRSRRDSPSCPGWVPGLSSLPRPFQPLLALSVVIFLADTAGLFFSFLSLLFEFGCYPCPINLPLCVALQHTPHPSRPKERSQGMQHFDPDGWCLAYGGDDDATCRWKKGPGLLGGAGGPQAAAAVGRRNHE
ncbi:hypothetical protein CCUS01_04394, partial [Colletotrichum cuscutae]